MVAAVTPCLPVSCWLLRVMPAVWLFVALPLAAAWHQHDGEAMGTRIHIELWHEQPAVAQAGIAAVMAEMTRIDQLMSPWIASSELARINREAANGWLPISAEMSALLARSLEFSRLSDGAFDITFASAGFLYDYRKAQRPQGPALQQAASHIDWRQLQLDVAHSRLRFGKPGVVIDLGGIAKGHAVDNAINRLKALGITHALVTAGGDARLLGDRRGRPWLVAIKDPRAADKEAVVLPLADVAVSTSGDYERYFVAEDGTRYHHILNPKTGDSARLVQSVTVIGADATTTDGYSTTVFVLGVERGLALVNQQPGVDALIIDANHKLHLSRGLTR